MLKIKKKEQDLRGVGFELPGVGQRQRQKERERAEEETAVCMSKLYVSLSKNNTISMSDKCHTHSNNHHSNSLPNTCFVCMFWCVHVCPWFFLSEPSENRLLDLLVASIPVDKELKTIQNEPSPNPKQRLEYLLPRIQCIQVTRMVMSNNTVKG